jgi:hypothetical protein
MRTTADSISSNAKASRMIGSMRKAIMMFAKVGSGFGPPLFAIRMGSVKVLLTICEATSMEC